MPQSSELPTTNQKWSPKDWNKDIFETDEQKSSLTTFTKLSHEFSVLRENIEIYQKFNAHLGSIASGLHHKGLLDDIFTTVGHLGNYITRLGKLRDEKQRGTPEPSKVEVVAKAIYDRYEARGDKFWDVFEAKVNMANSSERKPWLDRKEKVLKGVVGWTLTYLDDMDAEYRVGWEEEEVRTMKLDWEDRWMTYAAMHPEYLKTAGWILDA